MEQCQPEQAELQEDLSCYFVDSNDARLPSLPFSQPLPSCLMLLDEPTVSHVAGQ